MNEVKTPTLNSCPFCRNSVVLKQYGDSDIFSFYSVACPTCKTQTPMFTSEEEARKDWNSRTANPHKI